MLLTEQFGATVEATDPVRLRPGRARLVLHRISVPHDRLEGLGAHQVLAVVHRTTGPDDVRVDPRVDGLELQREGNSVALTLTVAVHAAPTALPSDPHPLSYSIELLERGRRPRVITRAEWVGTVQVEAFRTSKRLMARAFYGYRMFRRDSIRSVRILHARGVHVSLQENGRVPPLVGARPETVAILGAFEKSRRRMWMARSVLVTAAKRASPAMADVARRFLSNLHAPQHEWKGLPDIPIRSEISARPKDSQADAPEVLEPVTKYELGSERPEPERETPNQEVSVPRPTETPSNGSDGPTELGTVDKSSTAGFGAMGSYGRSLTLDDPNIAFGASSRFLYAEATTLFSARTATFFFFAQVALTDAFGLEATIPAQYVDLDEVEAESVFTAGNPLLAAKFRFHLPKIHQRRPALTVRIRYAIPVSPSTLLPPTSVVAESFTQEVNFVDSFAFQPDLHDIGAGANLAWRHRSLESITQLYIDYFFPVASEESLTDFFGISYGASVAYYPLPRDYIALIAEARGTSLLRSGGRTGAIANVGARGRIFRRFEPAVFVGFPMGAIDGASGVQIGAELRFSYDVERPCQTGQIDLEEGRSR